MLLEWNAALKQPARKINTNVESISSKCKAGESKCKVTAARTWTCRPSAARATCGGSNGSNIPAVEDRWRSCGGPAEAWWRLCSSLAKVCQRPGGSPAEALWWLCSVLAEARRRSGRGLAEAWWRLQRLGRGQTEVYQSPLAAKGVLVAAQVAGNKGWDWNRGAQIPMAEKLFAHKIYPCSQGVYFISSTWLSQTMSILCIPRSKDLLISMLCRSKKWSTDQHERILWMDRPFVIIEEMNTTIKHWKNWWISLFFLKKRRPNNS